MKFYADKVNIGYGDKMIVEGLNVEIPEGKIISLIGGNGSGKSTILKTMSRIISPNSGRVILDGKEIHTMPTKELAKKLSILPQNPESPEGLTVEELIAYGRAPYKSGFGRLNDKDIETVHWALDVTGMKEFAD